MQIFFGLYNSSKKIYLSYRTLYYNYACNKIAVQFKRQKFCEPNPMLWLRKYSCSQKKKERRVLVLYTGGTIGMIPTKDGMLLKSLRQIIYTNSEKHWIL